MTCLKLIGSYNIALIYIEEPHSIYAVKNSGDLTIATDLVKGHNYICSDSEILRDEFNLTNFEIVKENEIVRILPEGVEHFHILKNDSTMDKVKLKEGISHYFIQEMLE